MTPAADD
jgi:plasmid replication initiation protein